MTAGADRSRGSVIDDADALPQAHTHRSRTRLALVPTLFVLGVCGWSLIETPAELDPSLGHTGIAALAIAKTLWAAIGLAAARGVRRAQWLFSFLCGLSLVAIVPGLPVELNESVWVFSQSLIECLLKAGALIALGFSRASCASRSGGTAVAAWHVVSESSSDTVEQR
ncbi:conserved membrane hypothetical protein [Paraburkholderia piptadeniae]|uniref:Uncharacterized protein n=1 Tax=Paraburkholderia piptadeniae TaxID=1701573 RepID=A0A1N7RNZ4_9BURK|nr:conserved membrane hypothetical protein [Paraburkholderia piptadeniae]